MSRSTEVIAVIDVAKLARHRLEAIRSEYPYQDNVEYELMECVNQLDATMNQLRLVSKIIDEDKVNG